MTKEELPALDCHAHIASDVTGSQLNALGDVIVFAMTRSLDEAEVVANRMDSRLVWGCGVHPGLANAIDNFDEQRFVNLLPRYAIVGEIGLDRRSGSLPQQDMVLRLILKLVSDEPLLLSLHSSGCSDKLLDALAEWPHRGAILHWFTGSADAIERALELGCFFSVNASMSNEALSSIPIDRMLPETDYPIMRRKTGARIPGDIKLLEERIVHITGEPSNRIRRRWYHNLRSIAISSGALERLPDGLFELLMTA